MEQIKELEEVLELLNTKQYTKLRQYLAELNDADIAGLLEELEEEEMLKGLPYPSQGPGGRRFFLFRYGQSAEDHHVPVG